MLYDKLKKNLFGSLQMKEKNEIILHSKRPKYEKSNELVNAKFNISRLEQNILNYSLTKLRGKVFSEEDKKYGIKIEMTNEELIKYVFGNTKSHNIYGQLNNLSTRLLKNSLIIEDREKSSFYKIVIIKTCAYENGVFSMVFHEDLSSHIIHENKIPFTVLDYLTTKSLKSSNSVRIYELLEKMSYKMVNGKYEFTMNLIDLKFTLGFIDKDNDDVIRIFNKNYGNYDIIEKKLEELDNKLVAANKEPIHKYKEYKAFRRSVLEVARKEILQSAEEGISEFVFDYQPAEKRKKKVSAIKITIYESSAYHRLKQLEQDAEPHQITINEYEESSTDVFDVLGIKKLIDDNGAIEFFKKYDSYEYMKTIEPTKNEEKEFLYIIEKIVEAHFKDILEEPIKKTTIKNMLNAGNFDLLNIFHNIEYALYNKRSIKNIQAYLVDACKNNYANGKRISQEEKSKSNPAYIKSSFHHYEQRTDYDFDELEKILRGKNEKHN